MAELYGYLDPNTADWMDGLFANIFRDLNRPIDGEVLCYYRIPSSISRFASNDNNLCAYNWQEHRYICFDGDIDPVWVENMKTVMDENKLLTLANGERIRLEDHCSILFEVNYYFSHFSPFFGIPTSFTLVIACIKL